MSMYSNAVETITDISAKRQQELDAAAAEARAADIAAQRAAILAAVPADSPWRPVAELLAHTLTIGREDGYPAFNVPDTTRAVLAAAQAAGMDLPALLKIQTPRDLSVWKMDPEARATDYQAWEAATTFRRRQTVSSL